MTHASPDPVRATVIACARTVEYLAAGSGPPVMLFTRESCRSNLVEAIGRERRVICPILEGVASDDRADWLNGFLDGLGLEKIFAIIDDSCASMASAIQDSIGHRLSGQLRLGGTHHGIDTGSTPTSLAAAGPEP